MVDLSGGPDPNQDGRLTEGYYNFHAFAFNKWQKGPVPGALGKAVGVFLKEIRRPDLNIITAEWIGLSSRTEPPLARPRVVLACSDPVALDYHAFKYVLYPHSQLAIHNPDDHTSPVHHDLINCADQSGGTIYERDMIVETCCYRKNEWIKGPNGAIRAKKTWGLMGKNLWKYIYLKMSQ